MSNTFNALGVPADLVAVLDKQGITEPFPIQTAAIPDALAGRDLCGQAPTGSGKTIAFALALVAGLPNRSGEPRSPEALVLVPTRELCVQVSGELAPLAKVRGRKVVSVYGGVSDRPQRQALSKPGTIVVACPGRLEDLINQRALRLDKVRHVIIDEADQMSDMGFLPAVKRILDQTDPARQTQLFSATLGGPVASLVKKYQTDPVRHEVAATNPTVRIEDHEFRRIDRSDRVATTAKLIADNGSAIVFCRTRHGVSRLTKQLTGFGITAAELHGGRSQAQRDRALKAFADGKARALIATDVASRGIHVDDVACVIHFDLPADVDTYIHRSGRTGRAGAGGVVIALMDETTAKAGAILRKSLGVKATNNATSAPSPASAAHTTTAHTSTTHTQTSPTRSTTPSSNHPHSKPERSNKRERPSNLERPGNRERPSYRERPKNRDGADRVKGQRKTARPEDRNQWARRERVDGASAKKRHVTGRIATIHTHRGFGFISHEGANDIFMHHTNITEGDWRKLSVGDRVRFKIGPGPKGSQAVEITVI